MKLSVVIPLWHEEQHLASTIGVIRDALEPLRGDYELVLIDDGSTDGTWRVLRELAAAHPEILALRLSRNFGKELALCAGLERARGDAVVVMDGDLQHPPSLILDMVRAWEEEGFDVVEAVKRTRGPESALRRGEALLFYDLLRRLSGIDLRDASDFKLLDRKVLVAWTEMPERNVFFRGMSAWLGYRRKQIPFDVERRAAGASGWPGLRRAKLAVQGITAFSTLPMHAVTLMGVAFLAFAVVLGLYSLVLWARGVALTGFTTVNLLLL
ncbi:MAG TPA: glycosyltransferase family 2 protein, partial [Thermoanaerobaculia bacterium]|nr:glycosyltransferase family 2 protein [Thermoanaerobaculia bacterium]